ncbi:hypothetical protein ACFSJM_08440 [Lactococcus formosensis subsp. bovis]|uniref:hypothetical protein n=1 Tax=Lactococcus formosensis TaxID=1281486 RepID=UPI001BCE12EE|nr:hypothetical protein [Lactococcus formosensis]
MKKFEEELNNGLVSIGQNIITKEYAYGKCALINYFKDWVSPEDHQAEIRKIELQNLKYREEIARMQKSLRKKNKAIRELNGAVKKNKERLKECEDLRIEANNEAAKEYALKCEVVEERAEFKREIEKLKSQLKKQQPEIPEVPQFVADCLALIEANDYMISREQAIEHKEAIVWLEEHQSELMLPKCLLYGYTVEKPKWKAIVSPCPVCRYEDVESNFCGICGHKNEYMEVAKEKRFYLKNKFTGNYLSSVPESSDFYHIMVRDPEVNGLVRSFTQQEIASMATDSYEQIEVGE